MTFEKNSIGKTCIRLDDGAPVNFCKPSVEPMLASLRTLYGNKILTVILTGMGHDGRDECKALSEAGGRVIAQDEATSVVWGMPGAVAMAGICNAVLPLPEIGPRVKKAASGLSA
jgi:two-component system chemotaxis response regulator CheB